MIPKGKNPNSGHLRPSTKLTLEQEFKLKLVEDKLRERYDTHKEDVITVFLALQKQNFVLTNNLKNIINFI
jgi:hypothetical protein